jgi:uncharacterized protein YjbI with pentapeptide repeats
MHRIQSLLIRFPENRNEVAIPPRPRTAFESLNISGSPLSQRSSVTFSIPENSPGSGNPSSSEGPQDPYQSVSTRSSSTSTPRRVTYADQDTILRVAIHRSSAPSISEVLNRIEPWKKEIALFLLEHMKKKHHGSHFDRFIVWFFEKHVNLSSEQCHKLFDASRSKNLSLFSEIEIPKYAVSEICIKSAVQILIDHFASLAGVNLSGMDLTTIHILPNTDFSNVNLRSAYLVGMNLSGINLENANLTNANLSKSILLDAVLTHAVLDGTKLVETDLRNANLGGVQLAKIRPNGPDLSFAKLDYANLKWANFTSAIMNGTSLYGSNCTSASFNYANIKDANFDHTNLACADFTEATLNSVSFTNASNQSL